MNNLIRKVNSGSELIKLFLKVFSKKSPFNYRGDVDDVILLFTDGNPNPEDEQTSKANKYSKILKTRNVTIAGLAAGVPDEVEKFKHNIKKWTTSPQLVFEAELGQLDTVISKLVKASCEEIHGGKLILFVLDLVI